MITSQGKIHIKRYLSQQVSTIGGAIGFGVGTGAESINDTKLSLEITRADVNHITYDFQNDRIIFKASIPETFGGTIYEVGLWSLPTNLLAGAYGSKTLTDFATLTEWSAGTSVATNARAGSATVRLAPSASATATMYKAITLDMGGNSSADTILLAYYVGNAFTSNVKLRFKVDNSNYYEFTTSTPGTGYRIDSFSKGSATVVGAPNWATINQIEVATTATAGGAAAVDFDAVRIEDVDTPNPNYNLVSREVLTTPITKTVGKVMEIEYSLAVTI